MAIRALFIGGGGSSYFAAAAAKQGQGTPPQAAARRQRRRRVPLAPAAALPLVALGAGAEGGHTERGLGEAVASQWPEIRWVRAQAAATQMAPTLSEDWTRLRMG